MELGEPVVISRQDKKKKKIAHVVGSSLTVNSSETKEGKQKLRFNKLYKLN